MELVDTLVLQGGLGITTSVILWLFLQERKERHEVQSENAILRKEFHDHLKEDISEKVADRETLKQALNVVEALKKALEEK